MEKMERKIEMQKHHLYFLLFALIVVGSILAVVLARVFGKIWIHSEMFPFSITSIIPLTFGVGAKFKII